MKILYVTTISNTVNGFLIPHIKFLIKQKNEVNVAFNIVQDVSTELIKLGCKVHNVEFQRSPLKKANYNAYKRIKKIVLSEDYDLVHTHTPIASFLTRLACRNITKVKMLYTAHGFHFFKGAPLKNWAMYYNIEKFAARWTDVLITMNEEDYTAARKMKLRRINSVYKVHGIGIDLDKYLPQTIEKKSNLRKKYRYNDNDFILIYAGELSYRKHQDLLIDAIRLLKNKIPNIKLLLAGTGNLSEQYKRQTRNLGLQDNIEFLGYRKDIANLMMLSDIAVSSSRQEGLPVNVMEAIATGLPLVVTDSRGNNDLIINDDNGYVVGINDVDGFANAIEKLYNSEELRQKFKKKNIELIKMYSIENVIKEMEQIYSCHIDKK